MPDAPREKAALLPCPFCGKAPASRFYGDDDGGYHGIDCCRAFAHEPTEAEAIEAWNQRQPDLAAARAEGVEAMREACAKWHEEQAAYYDGVATQLTGANALSFAGYAKQHRDNAREIRALPIPAADALARRDDWQPIETAPKDGTRVLLWCVHANAAYSRDPIEEGWACTVIGQWIDHNGGGWTWHGLCGRITHWQPQPKPPAGARAVGEER